MDFLHILVPQKGSFYSLYVHGHYGDKKNLPEGTDFTVLPGTLVFLYYTYPAHRRAFAVRFTGSEKKGALFPGLSVPVTVLIRCHASKVDKLKKTISFLLAHFPELVFSMPDEFYTRLHFIIQQKGKVDYEKIHALVDFMNCKKLASSDAN